MKESWKVDVLYCLTASCIEGLMLQNLRFFVNRKQHKINYKNTPKLSDGKFDENMNRTGG